MKTLPLFIILLIVLSCQNKESDDLISRISIDVQKSLHEFSDTTFVGLTTDIHYFEGRIFLTESQNGRVIELNDDYQLIRMYGGKGDGPSELQFPESSQVHENQLLILDEGHKKIKAFNLDGTFSHAFGSEMPGSSGFFIQNERLYGSRYDKSILPIFSYDLMNEDSVQYFGSQTRKLIEINQDRPRHFYLFPYKNEIITVGQNEPIIIRLDREGKEIEELYFPEFFQVNIQKAKERQKTQPTMRSTTSFIINAKLVGNELYLLVPGFKAALGKSSSNQIFNFSISDSKIELTRIIELRNIKKDSWYLSFDIFDNKILAYEGMNYELHEFSLPGR